jgi:hypothetical protein
MIQELYSASKDQEILVWEAPRKDSELLDRRPEVSELSWQARIPIFHILTFWPPQ